MKVLVTGASGFIGKHFLDYITPIYGKENIFLLTSYSILDYICVIHKDYTFSKQDFFEKGVSNIDIIYHLGGAVPRTNKENTVDNIGFLSDNLVNTKHLLDNLPSIPKKIIYASSVSVYKNNSEIINEDSEYTDNDLYGISKLMTESFLAKEAERRGFILQILRLGQIYGEGEEKYEKIISSFLLHLMKNETIKIFGDGEFLRSNLYVKDVVKYIYAASLFDIYKNPINIASSNAVSLKMLFEMCFEIVGGGNVFYDITKSVGNSVYDTRRMKEFFPDIQETSLKVGIENLYNYLVNKNAGC